jgi:outer membrane protein TolC
VGVAGTAVAQTAGAAGTPPPESTGAPRVVPAAPAGGSSATAARPADRPFSLDEAVAYALQNNPRIGGAAAQIREARARITQRRAERGPQFGVNNYVLRQGPVIPGSLPGSAPAFPPYAWNVGVFVSQVLFDWGQRAHRQSAAEHETEAFRLRALETSNDVRLVVSTTFFNILRAEQLLTVAQERREAAAEQLRVARARFEADIAPRFDVIRSEAELANAEQDVIAAQNDVALANASFNTALGRDVVAPVALKYEAEPAHPEVPFEAARETAAANRPELEAIREDIRSGVEEVRARKAEARPQVGLTGAYNRPNPGGFASTAYRYNFGLTMSWPFFDSGFIRGRVRESQAVVEGNRQALEQTRQQVELDVRQAGLDIQEAQRRIIASQKEVSSAREALRVSQVRYRAGVGTNVEVTDAQVALARAGQNLANAQFDYETAISRLEFAAGVPIEKLLAPRPTSPGQPAAK